MKRNLIIFKILGLCAGCRTTVNVTGEIDALPSVYPDYIDITVPVNIAPLNFRCDSVSGPTALILAAGERRCTLKGLEFDIPLDQWHTLTASGDITATFCVKEKDGWKSFRPLHRLLSQRHRAILPLDRPQPHRGVRFRLGRRGL